MRVLYSDISESTERPTRETTDEGVSSYESNSCLSGPICEVTNMPDVPCTWSLPIPTEWIQICRSEPAFKAKNIINKRFAGGPGCSNQYVSGSEVRSSFRQHGRFFEIHHRSMRWHCFTPGKYEREILPVQRQRSDASSAAPCSVWCRRSSGSTRSLTGRLSASLWLSFASTRRSPATSGSCWGTRRLGLAARRARWPGTGSAWNRCAGWSIYRAESSFRSWAAMRSAFSNVAVHRLQTRADMNF